MPFDLDPQHKMIRDSIADLMSEFDADYWRERDAAHEFPEIFWETMGNNGWLGLPIPTEYGGQGGSLLDLAVGVEAICRNGPGFAGAFLYNLTPIFGGFSIAKHGTEDQKETYLPDLADGDLDFCMALTEPNTGHDTLSMTTTAKQDGDEYIINGEKIWISGVGRADKMLLVTRTTPVEELDSRSDGLTLFIVDPDQDGIEYTPIDKMGINISKSYQVFINDVRVSEDAVLGKVDQGWQHILETINAERVVVTAGCLGTAGLALEMGQQYATDREVFGRPIATNQAIQHPLVESSIDLEAARLLQYRAAAAYDEGEDMAVEMNMALYKAAQTAYTAADRSMQTHGSFGYAKEYDIERLFRDIRLVKMVPISQEMILNYLGKNHLNLPSSY